MTLPYFIACMSVYLVISRLVLEARLVEESLNLIPVEIGDADGFDQTGIDQLLQPLKHKTFHFNFFPPPPLNDPLLFVRPEELRRALDWMLDLCCITRTGLIQIQSFLKSSYCMHTK